MRTTRLIQAGPRFALWIVPLAALAGCSDPAAPPDPQAARVHVTNDYQFHLMGVPPGSSVAVATGINNAGVIVGWSASPGEHAFRYADGQWTVLPLARAYGINDAGWIVGSVDGSPAALSPTGEVTLLSRSTRTLDGTAFAINADNTVVGRSREPGGHWEATRWTLHDGVFIGQSLELVPSLESQATAVNDAGEIVGSVTVPTSRFGATRREAWTWHDGPLGESLGELDSGDDAIATAINNGGFLNPTGQIVGLGNLEPAGAPHAFVRPIITAGLVEMDLPGMSSALTGVSDGGRLVGWYTSSTPSPNELPYHDLDGLGGMETVPLNTVPFTRMSGKRIELAYQHQTPGDGVGATAVNRCGTIVGHFVNEFATQAVFWSKPLCDP